MKLQMSAIHFHADEKLIEFIQKRVDKLETFFDKIIDGEVVLKVEKEGHKENKVVEIKLNIPGNQVFAKEKSKSFEVAVDEVVEGLRRQLKKKKEKMMTH